MDKLYRVHFVHFPGRDGISVYIIAKYGDKKYEGKIKKDILVLEEIKDIPSNTGPCFEISGCDIDDGFLQALADGLGRIGIYPEATNTVPAYRQENDKHRAEAISEERKEQIEYLRILTEKMIFK